MKKLLLVSTYQKAKPKGNVFEQDVRFGPSLGQHRIASFVRKFNYNAEVFDPTLNGLDGLVEKVKSEKFDLIGFGTSHLTLPNDLYLSHIVREISPETTLFYGGIEATLNPKTVAEGGAANIIVKGEGEFAVLELLKDVREPWHGRIQFSHVDGILIRDSTSKTLLKTKNKSQLTDYNFKWVSQQIDFKSIPYKEYWKKGSPKIAAIISANYCPAGCHFCSSTNFLKKSQESPAKMYSLNGDELFELYNKVVSEVPDMKTLYINDDDFLFGAKMQKRAKEFAKKIISDVSPDDRIPMLIQSRIDDVDEDLLNILYDAGVRTIGYGVENLSESGLISSNKGINPEQAIETIAKTVNSDITPWSNFILGMPHLNYEGLVENLESFNQLWDVGVPVACYPFVIPFKGSWYAENDPYMSDIIKGTYDVGDTGISIEMNDRLKIYDSKVEDLILLGMELSGPVAYETKEFLGVNSIPSHVQSMVYTISLLRAHSKLGIKSELSFNEEDVFNHYISQFKTESYGVGEIEIEE